SVLPSVPLHLWGIKLDALRSIDLTNVTSSDSAVWHQSMYVSGEIAEQAALAHMSMRRYKITVKLPAYVDKVYQAVEESRSITASRHDQMLLREVRALLKSQGWTLHMRTRRNRQYVYAARRDGRRIEQTFICPLSELSEWLEG